MRRLLPLFVGVSFAAALVFGTQRAHSQKPSDARQKAEVSAPLKPLELFQGTLTLMTKEGKAMPVHVMIRQWDMLRGERVEKFTEKGFAILQLRGGQVKTIMDGKEQQRRHDEFWVLPAGVPMTIVVTSEEAVLQTVVIGKP